MFKREETLAEYGNYIHVLAGCKDFSPNDGVNTQHIFGTAANNYDGSGDYLIVTDDRGNMLSRWFIIETQFTRAGQWLITLRRDLVADYYEDVVNAPCFIEKATLPSNSPLIFNSEQMTFNQIKTRETLLKDKSGCPWIVGYYAKNTANDNLKGTVNGNVLDDVYDYVLDRNIENWEFYKYTQQNFVTAPSNVNWRFYGKNITDGNSGWFDIKHPGEYVTYYIVNNGSQVSFGNLSPRLYSGPRLAEQVKANASTLLSQLSAYVTYNNDSTLREFLNYKDSIIKDASGRFFKITITPSDTINKLTDITSGNLFNTLSTVLAGVANASGTPNANTFKVDTTHSTYKLGIEELAQLESIWDMTGAKIVTENAPYNVFAIPYGEVELQLNNQTIATSNENDSIAAANAIIQQMDTNLYDIQLLPYCPIVLDEDGVINVKSSLQYSLITAPGEANSRTPIGFILNVASARFTKNIYLDEPIVINNPKIENECDMYKLCSPNWASEYQFSAAKNNGIQYFNIDCEYKPFMPYIHINPNFGGLYGQDFNDARGLILSGDFSLAQITDQWQQYQTQNKNFQNIFDRQIQNMEVQHDVARTQDIVGAIAGAATGATSGALVGGMLGGPVGGYIGAATGGIASAAGGIADYAVNERLRNEALDYTKDMFGYQLGNIQALPYTLTKVSSFNNNNKIFPVLEYYTCTDIEKEALANKIAWNGMSVGVIGTLGNYIGNTWSYNNIESKGYIKGRIIRIENLEDEFHLLKELANEIYKGVYF